jgi:hypothetical protein
MKKLTVTIVVMTALFIVAAAPSAHAVGWFYLTVKVTKTGNQVSESKVFSTLAGCEAKAQTASPLLEDCVVDCDLANPLSQYFLEQEIDGTFHGFGPFGLQADCQTGSSAAATAVSPGVNILETCTFVSARHACN